MTAELLKKEKEKFSKELRKLQLKTLEKLMASGDCTGKEAAEILGVTEGTVRYLKGQLTKAKKAKETKTSK